MCSRIAVLAINLQEDGVVIMGKVYGGENVDDLVITVSGFFLNVHLLLITPLLHLSISWNDI